MISQLTNFAPTNALSNATAEAAKGSPAATENHSFLDALSSVVEQFEGVQQASEQSVENLVSGQSQDVHSTMIAVEQANLAFELAVQVRNKVVNAYQEISRLQF
jgi:flagellar hook-basal body complex protein FliE